MDNETLRKVQLVQLEMAKEVKRICEENNIKYFLDGGTLLGAVRHGGFIPWDDDLDIAMMREDYEKFLRIAPEKLSSEYFLQTWKSDKNYPLPFAKLRKLGTVFVERIYKNIDMEHGIWIDIFPYDSYPDTIKEQKKYNFIFRFYRALLVFKSGTEICNDYTSKKEKILTKIKHYPILFISKFCRQEKILFNYDIFLKKYNNEKTEKIVIPIGNWIISRKCYNNTSELMFEDEIFPVPGDSHLYLSEAYGDYMTPPPENERGNKHNIIDVKL